jgi:hypothetical protein
LISATHEKKDFFKIPVFDKDRLFLLLVENSKKSKTIVATMIAGSTTVGQSTRRYESIALDLSYTRKKELLQKTFFDKDRGDLLLVLELKKKKTSCSCTGFCSPKTQGNCQKSYTIRLGRVSVVKHYLVIHDREIPKKLKEMVRGKPSSKQLFLDLEFLVGRIVACEGSKERGKVEKVIKLLGGGGTKEVRPGVQLCNGKMSLSAGVT